MTMGNFDFDAMFFASILAAAQFGFCVIDHVKLITTVQAVLYTY
jgi:hypothetical protein